MKPTIAMMLMCLPVVTACDREKASDTAKADGTTTAVAAAPSASTSAAVDRLTPPSYARECSSSNRPTWIDLAVRMTGEPQATARMWRAHNHKDRVEALAWSADGVLLASGGDDDDVRATDVVCGTQRATLAVPRAEYGVETMGLAFSPSRELVSSVGASAKDRDGEHVFLWSIVTKKSQVLKGPTNTMNATVFTPNGRYIAAGGWGSGREQPATPANTLLVWDVESGKMLHNLEGHVGRIDSLAISPDSRTLASGGADGLVILWDLEQGREANRYAFSPDHVRNGHNYDAIVQALFFDESGRRLFAAIDAFDSRKDRLFELEPEGSKRRLIVETARGNVAAMALHEKAGWLVTGGADKRLRAWRISDGAALWAVPMAKAPINVLALSPSGDFLGVGTGPGKIGGQPGKHNEVIVVDMSNLLQH